MKRGNPVFALLDDTLAQISHFTQIRKSHPSSSDPAQTAALIAGNGAWPPRPAYDLGAARTQPAALAPMLHPINRKWSQHYTAAAVTMPSPVAGDPPNNLIHALHVYRADTPTAPTMLYVHGWGVETLWLRVNLGLHWLARLGMNLLLIEQPYHMQRTPTDSYYSGEFSIGADLPQTVRSMQQATWDVQAMVGWLLAQGVSSVGVAGESLGGLVTALAAQFEPRLAYAIPLMPAVRLDRVFWRSQLSRFTRAGLEAQGLTPTQTAAALKTIFPGRYRPAIDPQRIMIMQGRADRTVFPEYALRLAERWGSRLVLSGHSHTTLILGASTARHIRQFVGEWAT